MKKLLLALLTVLFFSSQAYAIAPDIRLSDEDSHVLNVNADGTISVSGTGSFSTVSADSLAVNGSSNIGKVSTDTMIVSGDTYMVNMNTRFCDATTDTELSACISNAKAGDAIYLTSSTITLNADVTINKALSLRGMGKGKTVLSSTTNGASLIITADNVSISDMSFSWTGITGATDVLYLNATGGSVFYNVHLTNLMFTWSANTDTVSNVIHVNDSGFIGSNIDITMTNSNASTSDTGICFNQQATAEAPTYSFLSGVRITQTNANSTAGTSSAIRVRDNSATQDVIVRSFNSYYKSTCSSGNGSGTLVQGADGFLYSSGDFFSGTLFDIQRTSSGVISIYSSTALDNKVVGPITEGGTTISKNVSVDGTFVSTSTGSIGWTMQTAANQACNTTCVHGCAFGQDLNSATFTVVSCDDVLADACLCAGIN